MLAIDMLWNEDICDGERRYRSANLRLEDTRMCLSS